MQVCVLDGRLYAEVEGEAAGGDAGLDGCVLLAGNQGKELLAPGPDEDYSDDRKVVIRLQDGKVGRLCVCQCNGQGMHAMGARPCGTPAHNTEGTARWERGRARKRTPLPARMRGKPSGCMQWAPAPWHNASPWHGATPCGALLLL